MYGAPVSAVIFQQEPASACQKVFGYQGPAPRGPWVKRFLLGAVGSELAAGRAFTATLFEEAHAAPAIGGLVPWALTSQVRSCLARNGVPLRRY